MNEENVKLARIKKSSHTGKIVSNILCIITIVGCVLAIVAGIAILSMGSRFDEALSAAQEQGTVTMSTKIGSANLFNIDLGDPESIESDIPALQEAIDDHPLSIAYGTYILTMGLFIAVVAVMMKLVSTVFALIEKEDTPFSDKVRKRVTIVLGITSVILLMSSGAAFGILCGLITWVVYTILDYGKTLQIQSDETL
ncbi:MAG: hypothetical protein IJ757_09565 [Clostridiales bacterium]|nr:hypothetical protein [Clostridiales bacterium]